MQTSDHNFEALLYSATPHLAEQCVKSLANFPANWISFNEPEIAGDFLAKSRFDFVVLDLDCEHGRPLLQQLCDSGKARQSVIFAVTRGAVDASNLALCYEFGVFYPVRPTEIRANLNRTLPAAERLAQHRLSVEVEGQRSASDSEACQEPKSSMPKLLEEMLHTSKVLAWLFATFAAGIFGMRHSLGIAAQERVASLLSAFATLWFVQESTASFRGLMNLAPPSAGPTYLLALSLLLWLCAKQRRLTRNDATRAAVRG